MAAHLKKRALAEYSQVIQEEQPKQKKLRLTQTQAKPPEPPIDLKECSTTAEICGQLLRLEGCLPLSAEVTDIVLVQLKAYYYPEQDPLIKSLIVSLLGQLGQLPHVDSSYIIGDLISWTKSETSHQLLAQMLTSLVEIGSAVTLDMTLTRNLLQLAVVHLRDSSHLVRCKCLEMIGCLGMAQDMTSIKSLPPGGLQTLLGNFTMDNDPRVRCSAFKAMLKWHDRGLNLSESLYSEVCRALNDDYEGVRVCVVHIIWVMCQQYQNSLVKVSLTEDEQIRLVDDGFAKICDMVNDISLVVRTKAASLLGSLHNVSPRFLEQTLDKKLMSNMRLKQSAHERNKQHFECGEWSTGQKWADDAPKDEVEAEAISLMSSGACGAFVHGLEDEFSEVRNAAIDSISELAQRSPMFAILSQDFLVDMLNDEIDTVRLNAINSLEKMSEHIVLREDQLDSVLSVLKDFSGEIRKALREMFCGVTLGNKACLNSCLLALLDNLRRYPADRTSIWKCLKYLGSKHSLLVLSMAPDLLSCHPYFESQEPDVDDPAYVSILILVFCATVKCPTIMALFPDYATRHYSYLRDTLPDLVPQLQLSVADTMPDEMSQSSVTSRATSFLNETLTRLENLENLDSESALSLLNIGVRDLHSVAELDPNLSAIATCHALYLDSQQLIFKMLKAYTEDSSIRAGDVENTAISGHIQQMHEMTNKLQHCFLGLGPAEKLQVEQLRLCLNTIQLLLQIQSTAGGSKASCVHFLQILHSLQSELTSSGVVPDALTHHLLSNLHNLESFELLTYSPILENALNLHRCQTLRLSSRLQQAYAHITEPTGKSEVALRFIAGLTMAIDVEASVQNVQNLQDIWIRVTYPDQETQYSQPQQSQVKELSSNKHHIQAKVLLSHSKWSEACHVEVCLVLRYKEGIQIRPKYDSSSSRSECTFLELSRPVSVLVAPAGEKR